MLFAALFSAGCGEQEYNVYFRVNGTGTLGKQDKIKYWNNDDEIIELGEGTVLPWQHEEEFGCDKVIDLDANCIDDSTCVITDYYISINGKKYDKAKAEGQTLSGLPSTPACRWW